MQNSKTADIILQMLEKAKYDCFVKDIHNITSNLGMNMMDIIISRKCTNVESVYDEIEENTSIELIHCFNNWNIHDCRKRFVNIMEERVVRNQNHG